MARKSDKTIRSEYTFALVTMKAIKRQFEKAGYSNVKSMRKAYEAVQGATTRRDMEKAISEFNDYRNLETATVEGYKNKVRTTIEFWKNLGVKGVNLRNFEQFVDFLEWTRSFSGIKYRKGSDLTAWRNKVAEAWNDAEGDVDTAFEFYQSMVVDV